MSFGDESLIHSQDACEQLLKQYGVRENLDSLHAVVTEARARKQAGYNGHDVWREDLSPGAAVRARTVPVLEKERERLRTELQSVRLLDVSHLFSKQSFAQLDTENRRLQSEMQENVRAREEVDAEASQLLCFLSEVSLWPLAVHTLGFHIFVA